MKRNLLLLFLLSVVSANVLEVAVYDFPPCVILQRGSDGSIEKPTGFDIDVFEAVCKEAELQIRYIYSEKFPDLLSGVERGIYDGAVSGITITGEREGKVDFTHPYLNSGLCILINKGAKVNPLKTVFRYVSNIGPMLLLITLLAATFGVFIFFLEKWFARKESMFSPDEPAIGMFNGYYFGNVASTTMGFGDFVPKSIPGKILTVIFAWIGIYFIIPYATANMNMALQQEQEIYSISSPEDLPGKIIATEDSTTSADYLNDIGCNVKAVHGINEAYELLGRKKVDAVVFDMPTIKYFVKNKGKGRFIVSGPLFDLQSYGFALKKDSPYRKIINERLADFMRTEEYWELHKRWFGDE